MGQMDFMDRLAYDPAVSDNPVTTPEPVEVGCLRVHPKEFRKPTPALIDHAVRTIKESGFVRALTIARDGSILSGMDLYLGAMRLGLAKVPAIRLDLDPEEIPALKVLIGSPGHHLHETDDRALVDLLKYVKDASPDGLAGTGYDEMMLANLIFITRPASEVRDFNAAAHWVGMPHYEPGTEQAKLIIGFKDESDREEFLRINGLTGKRRQSGNTLSTQWPPQAEMDRRNLLFEG